MISSSLCLADAHIFIDGAKYGFLNAFLATRTIGVASSAFVEVRFYRDQTGDEHPIDLQPFVDTGELTVVSATGSELQAFYARDVSTRLGAGEIESIALVMSRGMSFCTADYLAVKTMRDLGLYDRWISLEELLATLQPPLQAPDPKYLRASLDPN